MIERIVSRLEDAFRTLRGRATQRRETNRVPGDCGNPTKDDAAGCAALRADFPRNDRGDVTHDADKLDRDCVIIPHGATSPGRLEIDIHTAILIVLQRPEHRDAGLEIRDPMNVTTITRQTPAGPRHATVIRWWMPGERPIDDLDLDPIEPPPADPAALPRMDAGIEYVRDNVAPPPPKA